MSVELSAKRNGAWVENAVLSLDRWLRQRAGVYEFSTDAHCLFRIEPAQADQTVTLSDGTRVRHGAPILKLHIWNEHMPPIPPPGPTVAWGRQAQRAVRNSLQLLAMHIKQRSELHEVVAIRGDIRLGPARKTQQVARIMSRFGFEPVRFDETTRPSTLRHIGENIHMFMLVLATNPMALRGSVLLRSKQRMYLSRASLERSYGAGWSAPASSTVSGALLLPDSPSPG